MSHQILIKGPNDNPAGYMYRVFVDGNQVEGCTSVSLDIRADASAHVCITIAGKKDVVFETDQYEVEGAADVLGEDDDAPTRGRPAP